MENNNEIKNEIKFKSLIIRYEKYIHYVFDTEGTHIFLNKFNNEINTKYIDDNYFIVIYDKYILLCSAQDEHLKFEAIYPLNSENSNINMFKANKSYLCVTYHPIEFSPALINVMKNNDVEIKYEKINKNNSYFQYNFDLKDIKFVNSFAYQDSFNGGHLHSLSDDNILKMIDHHTGKLKEDYNLDEDMKQYLS